MVHAQSGRWDQALTAFTRSLELDSRSPTPWCERAVIRLFTDDVKGFRHDCRELLSRFGKTADPQRAASIARACALAADGGEDIEALRKLAARAVFGPETSQFSHFFLVTKALVEYRAGEYAAVLALEKQLAPRVDGSCSQATVFALLALAHHGLGDREPARKALAQARAILDQKMPDPGQGRPFGEDWRYWLEARLLYREAAALIGPARVAPKGARP
jgi:hypothetical protein